MNSYETWLNMSDNEAKDALMYKISCNRQAYKQFVEDAIQWREQKTRKIYKYFITFTTRPETRKSSLEFLESQATRESLKIIYFRYVAEHEAENLHYHVEIHTLRPLEKGDFKHWTNTRGHVDFKSIKLGTEGQVNSYMLKEGVPKVVVELT